MLSQSLLHLRAVALALALGVVAGGVWAEPNAAVDPLAPLMERSSMDTTPAHAMPASEVPARDTTLRGQVRDAASGMVLTAMNFLGVPYKRGGTSAETGFDCSGFTRHVFENTLGLVLPRRADEQAKASNLLTVKRDELKPGDLVFFNTMKRTFSHVGIYVGEGKFIHSPRSGAEVRIEDMRFAYWAKRFTGGRRADESNGPATSSNTSLSGTALSASLSNGFSTALVAPVAESAPPAKARPVIRRAAVKKKNNSAR
jgi:cell wall-associated NlpC family hydrolase